MKRILKRFLIVGLIALVGIQFIPADVNKHAVIPDADFRYVYDVPDNLVNILKTLVTTVIATILITLGIAIFNLSG